MDLGHALFTNCEMDLSCRACNVPILYKSVSCPKCLRYFHETCVNTDALTKSSGFVRCCGPGHGKSANSGKKFQFTLEDIQRTFRDEIASLAWWLDNFEIWLDNLDTYLKNFSSKGISEHSTIVELKQKVDSIVLTTSGASSMSEASHELLKEFDDRLCRRSNFMVYDFTEHESSGSNE